MSLLRRSWRCHLTWGPATARGVSKVIPFVSHANFRVDVLAPMILFLIVRLTT